MHAVKRMINPPRPLRGLLFFVWLSLVLGSAATTPLCKITESWTRLNQRLQQEGLALGQNLTAKLNGNPSIAANARFQNHPSGLSPRMAAHQEIDEALGAAEEAAPTLLGDLASNQFIETATLPRVVSTHTISYEIQGAGMGKIAERCQNAGLDPDLTVSKILAARKANFDTITRPWHGKYNEAHYLRDMGDISDAAASRNINIAEFLTEQTGQGAGHPFEVRVAAARRNEGLEALAADNLYYGADVVTQPAVYNVGLTIQTISGKLTNVELPKIKKAIFDAADTAGGAKSYEFATSVKTMTLAEANVLQGRLDALNNDIQLDRPGFRVYTIADIILEQFQ